MAFRFVSGAGLGLLLVFTATGAGVWRTATEEVAPENKDMSMTGRLFENTTEAVLDAGHGIFKGISDKVGQNMPEVKTTLETYTYELDLDTAPNPSPTPQRIPSPDQ